MPAAAAIIDQMIKGVDFEEDATVVILDLLPNKNLFCAWQHFFPCFSHHSLKLIPSALIVDLRSEWAASGQILICPMLKLVVCKTLAVRCCQVFHKKI